MEEDNRTPEEKEAKKEALEKKKATHRRFSTARRALKIGAIATIGLFGKPAETEAQGFKLEPVRTTQAPQRGTYNPDSCDPDSYGPEIRGSKAWAIEHGYTMFDRRLTARLNHRGMLNDDGSLKHKGYYAAYRNPYNGRVFLVPNDPIADPDLAQSYSAEMIKIYRNGNHGVGSGPFEPSNMRGAYRYGGWSYGETSVERAGRIVRSIDRTIRDVKYTYDVVTGKHH